MHLPANPIHSAHFDGTGQLLPPLRGRRARRARLFDETGKEGPYRLPRSMVSWPGISRTVGPASATGSVSTAVGARKASGATGELLLDPYAKAIEGGVEWDEAVFPYWFDNPEARQRSRQARRSCPGPSWSAVLRLGQRAPAPPPLRNIIYELTSRASPSDTGDSRRTCAARTPAGPSGPSSTREARVTALELVPVHQSSR